MDGLGENVEEIFDDVVDGIADAVTDIDAPILMGVWASTGCGSAANTTPARATGARRFQDVIVM